MKYLIFILAFCFPAIIFAQAKEAKMLYYEVIGNDTLGTSTTVIKEFENRYGFDNDFNDLYEYSWIVVADSVSGANAGTISLQFSNDRDTTTSPIWYTSTTSTIDGNVQQLFSYEGTIKARRTRLLITSPSGTRVTRVRTYGIAKRIK